MFLLSNKSNNNLLRNILLRFYRPINTEIWEDLQTKEKIDVNVNEKKKTY